MHFKQQVQINTLHNQLIKLTQAWAMRRTFDPEQACALRTQALLLNHAHYLAHIPIYQRLARQEKIGALDSLEPIKQQLMSTDDIFKSYQQRWLDEANFTQMNAWLTQIHHAPLTVDLTAVQSIDQWIARLETVGVKLVYSSGTSGVFSFVPRDTANWALLKQANTCYLLPLLLYAKLGSAWQRHLVRAASRFLSPRQFETMTQHFSGAQQFDGFFLDFQNGRTGMQAIGSEVGPLFRRRFFLYPLDLTATVLRTLARGPRTEDERAALLTLQTETVQHKEQNFACFVEQLKQSTATGQRIFLFGAPFQFKALCEYIAQTQASLRLHPESLVLFGGGWKTFSGEQMSHAALATLITEHLGLPAARILEGYSMTEANVFMVRCDHGRFHLPPLLEPVLFDEALAPLAGTTGRGIFGFLDPLAQAYPGFIITGDVVRMVDDRCPCGLQGPALTEIARAQNREVKGCAGVMASVRA